MKLSLQTTHIQEIPVLTLAPEEAEGCPVLFYVPGYGGNKESGLSLGYRLAKRGFLVISFDPLWHGERFDERLFTPHHSHYPAETGLDIGLTFYRIIAQCLDDVQTVRAHFASDSRADVNRCGITGFSLGAYASYLVFAQVPEMLAAAPLMGIPQFSQRWHDILDECTFSNPAWATALQQVTAQTAQHTAFIEQIDPYPQLFAAAPRALLMVNGDFDTDQPKLYALNAYRKLREVYAAAADHLRLFIPPVAHTVTPDMEQAVADWFTIHLLTNL
ncbi:MAG: prolyl oligopeptidase family serine peptidase [Candidatus Promineifilaceae bacterium]